MTTKLTLNKYNNEYLLEVFISEPGRAGISQQIAISKSDWEELKTLGINDITE